MKFLSFQLILLFTVLCACNKMIDPGLPENRIVAAQIFSNDSLLTLAAKGMYSKIMEAFGLLNGQMTRFGGFCSDELDRNTLSDADLPFLNNSLTKEDARLKTIWQQCYNFIYQSNEMIEGLQQATVSAKLRDQVAGESYFLRAICYFYLVNTFGPVPLVLTTDYHQSATLPRLTIDKIYEQMTADLEKAQQLLTDDYAARSEFPNERIRANRMAALALGARINLYRGKWKEAEEMATQVIQSPRYQLEPDLTKVFVHNSQEAILQFQPVSLVYNTAEGGMFVPINPNAKPSIVLKHELVTVFGPTDKRLSWIRSVTVGGITYYSPYKYKLNQGPPYGEYNTVLRLAEQYLVRAEARAWRNDLPGARADIDVIRSRAGLVPLSVWNNRQQLLLAIEQERRIELFAEWGHRWLDLKRWPGITNPSDPSQSRVDEIMSALKPAYWQPTDKLWPIPASELLLNAYLTQNAGY